MKINQLDIRDFGVFQGEKLENLEQGIIVVGGANRSGKTTLMEILRNVPYGFSQNSNMPPAKFQYDVRCDLELEDSDVANVLLKGFSSPEIVYKSGKHYKGLYNIDKATYKELFTISLDELNKSSDKEDSNLQAMLLGAGYRHIVKIPELAKKLREKANNIGGTRGNPSTKMFKPFTENIKKGLEGRKKSMSLLGAFVQKKNILLQLEDTIISKENQLQTSNNNITKLELLKHNYMLNENRENIEIELEAYSFKLEDMKEYNIEKAKALKSLYIKELEQYNNDNGEFQREAFKNSIGKELLLKNKTVITSFYNGISGIKEMTKNLSSLRLEYNEKTQSLKSKIKKANDNWTSLTDIEEINCDDVQQGILMKNIEGFRKIKVEKVACNKSIEDFKIKSEILEKQSKSYDVAAPMKKYFNFTIFFIILGFGLFFVDKLLGSSIIITGVMGTSVYLFINYSSSRAITKQNEEIKVQMDDTSASFIEASQQLKKIDENLRIIENIMDEYRDILKLDGRVTEEGIKDYFKMAAYLKDEISDYNLSYIKLMVHFNDLCELLNSITKVLNEFTEISEGINAKEIKLDNAQNVSDDLLKKVEFLYKHLILGEKTENSFSSLSKLQQEILVFLGKSSFEEYLKQYNAGDIILDIDRYIKQGSQYIRYAKQKMELKIIQEKLLQGVKSQRIKKILYDERKDTQKFQDENTSLLIILKELFQQYISMEELSNEYDAINDKAKSLTDELDSLKNQKQTIKDEIQGLNSDEMLLKYDKDIKEARQHLRPLAERYAVYSTAALFLEKIRERFLENTKDKLLKGASEILSEITSGEYKDIMPMEDIMQGDFKTVLRDETIKTSSKELSRGTKEQLFLAVRISRIKEINQRLPVILDDSFVNFDIAHTKNTVKALVELSKTHQIFVLTCHGSLVELIKAETSKAQYFKLDKGKFSKSTGRDLKEYLNEL